MKPSTVPILIILTTFSAGCSGKPPLVTPRVCPPYPAMPAEAKCWLRMNAATAASCESAEPTHPKAGTEALWDWLSEIAVLRDQLEACRS